MIKIFVLITGEKVIGDVNQTSVSNEEFITIKEPFLLKEAFTEKGYQLVPLPLIPTLDKSVKIYKASLMTDFCEPPKDLHDMYVQITSNIVIANGKMSDLKIQ